MKSGYYWVKKPVANPNYLKIDFSEYTKSGERINTEDETIDWHIVWYDETYDEFYYGAYTWKTGDLQEIDTRQIIQPPYESNHKITVDDINKQSYLVLSNINAVKVVQPITDDQHETLLNSFITLQGMFNKYINQYDLNNFTISGEPDNIQNHQKNKPVSFSEELNKQL